MLRKAQERANTEKNVPAHTDDKLSLERIEKYWRELSEDEISNRNPKFGAALMKLSIDFSQEDMQLKIIVDNQKQKDWIEANRLQIIKEFLKDKIGDNLNIIVTITNSKDLYMPSQKAKRMMEKSEELRELQKKLELDIE